jgi:putative transposase
MNRTFCYPISPTDAQEHDLLDVLENVRLLFNGCIQERREGWNKLHTSVTLYDQMKSLTAIRAQDPVYAAIAVEIARSALKRVDKAFKAFFRRCKAGDMPGYPRFKKFGRYKSFTFAFSKKTINGEGRSARLRIPNFGDVRINLYRPLKGRPLEVTVRVDGAGQWWAAISCDIGAAPLPAEPLTIVPEEVVGADVGITALVAFSDGATLRNPRHFEKSAAQLKRRQQEYARKRKGSRSKLRALRMVAKIHRHIANQRKDYHRKSACEVMARCKAVVFEKLNIAGLARAQLGKHVNLAAWRQYQQTMICKAEEAGKLVLFVDPRQTSQLCSGCGALVQKELEERRHHCEACGLSLDRDVNAARNIRFRGLAALGMSVVEVSTAKAKRPNRRSKSSSAVADELG